MINKFEDYHPVAKDNLIMEKGDFNASWQNTIKHDDYVPPYNLLI